MTDDLTADLTGLLVPLDPLRDDELVRVLELGRARGGAERISATRWRPRPTGGRAIGFAAAVAAAASVAAVAAMVVALSSSSPQAAYALSFSESGGYVIARIVDPYASVDELRRELAQNHLHVELRLLPVSPGTVGEVVAFDVDGKPANGIQPLYEGHCVNGPCTVGVKVARDFKGGGSVYVGRPARHGERYASTPIGGAFAPGEALHCSGLQGETVARVMPALREKGLKVTAWRAMEASSSKPGAAAPAGARVEEVMPIEPGEVELWVSSTRAGQAQPSAPVPQAAHGVKAAAGVRAGTGNFAALHAQSMSGCKKS